MINASNARRNYDHDFYKQIIYKINSIVAKTSKNRSRKEAKLYESSSRVIVFDNRQPSFWNSKLSTKMKLERLKFIRTTP